MYKIIQHYLSSFLVAVLYLIQPHLACIGWSVCYYVFLFYFIIFSVHI